MSTMPGTIERDEEQTVRLVLTLWIILGVSLFVHVLCLFAGRWWASDWRWPHEPFHSTVEMAGGMIAMGVAWMLLSLQRLGAGTSFNIWIAAALAGMGILDGLHAMVHVGQTFVWLHSAATLAGGVLFAMVWFPRRWQQHARAWPWIVVMIALAFGVFSIVQADRLPVMAVDGRFTFLAKACNVVGGILLFAAAVRLVLTYRQEKNLDDLLFCLHCALFGAAAVMFEQSRLWDVPWWGWHLLRLMAYAVALWFVVETDIRAAAAVRAQAVTQARIQALEETGEQLANANDRLEQEQFLLNMLVNNIPDPVFFKDRQGRLIRANQAMANDAGVASPEQLIGKTDAEIWSGDFHLESAEDERRVMETGEPLINKEEMPMLEGGPPRWVLVTKMPLRGEGGEINGLFGVAREITKIKQQELERQRQSEALAQAKEALERSNADLQQFAYVASHDLQEPLRAVAGHCQLLEAEIGEQADDRVKMFLGHAVDGAKRMQELISHLLEYSRVPSRGQEFAEVEMDAVARAAISNLDVSIKETGAVLDVSHLPCVMGDDGQLVRLFQNLIGNAIKFCPDATPQIRIRAERESDHWVFSIRDNGIGLEKQYAERIFVIFQRLHGRSQYPGTGLGLAISKRIVERHGGEIWVESEPGDGSTFFFKLPDAQSPDAQSPDAQSPDAQPPTPSVQE